MSAARPSLPAGLAVSLGIAQMHGGDLSARSEPGAGAAFVLRLPVYREAAAA